MGQQKENKEAAILASRNKLHNCHYRKHKGNRKRPQNHCQLCGKLVSTFNIKHYYVACAKKEMKEVRHQKDKYGKGTSKTMMCQLLRTMSTDLFIIYTKQRIA